MTNSLRYLKGVGPRRADALAREGIQTLEDLLYVLPFRYEDRRSFTRLADLRAGGPQTAVEVQVASSRLIRTRRRGFTIFEARLADDSGSVRGVWYNQGYLARVLTEGRLLLDRDSRTRVRFEVRSRSDYFDLQPVLQRYRRLGKKAG